MGLKACFQIEDEALKLKPKGTDIVRSSSSFEKESLGLSSWLQYYVTHKYADVLQLYNHVMEYNLQVEEIKCIISISCGNLQLIF